MKREKKLTNAMAEPPLDGSESLAMLPMFEYQRLLRPVLTPSVKKRSVTPVSFLFALS
jgi:hypothetical protein